MQRQSSSLVLLLESFRDLGHLSLLELKNVVFGISPDFRKVNLVDLAEIAFLR